ncbi:isopenicillin N synthase family oxygenase, partial [Myxococcota bacterium]|nr:isopenicillin N synthase family oxygenase [Myxococcota bacterium]
APYQKELGRDRRQSLLRLFSLPPDAQRNLWKKNFEAQNSNLYRGWFPLHPADSFRREGFEIGPDCVRPLPELNTPDVLCEPSVFPPENLLPDWRDHVNDFYLAMERIGNLLMASLSRSLGISESIFANAFQGGISTLRLLRYPQRDMRPSSVEAKRSASIVHDHKKLEIVCGAHVDTGLVTLLADCDVPGLQAQSPSGDWIDVEIPEGGFAVNFGGLLSRWTGQRLRATRHRVVSSGLERFSIPFFLEPRPDALIAPLPIPDIEPFKPFLFGDYLWEKTTRFHENYGLEHLRPPQPDYQDPWAAP